MADGAVRRKTVDGFAGWGGVSHGFELATGSSPDVALNHWDLAVAIHALNHPKTRHFCEDIRKVDPAYALDGDEIDIGWFSPDCTQHSNAKGGKPRDNELRDLPEVIPERWAPWIRKVLLIENVPEFADWGPLGDDGKPDKSRKGESFRTWVGKLEALGFVVEWKVLSCHHYGAPTSRRRLFIIARRDGQPIVWPKPTHGPGLLPFRTAAECIDFTIPSLSIFATKDEARAFAKRFGCGVPKRPLEAKTLARIARGIWRFVLNNPRPFTFPVNHGGDLRVHDLADPLRTITASRREHGLVSPVLVQSGYGEREGQAPRVLDLEAPFPTVVGCGVKAGVVEAFLAPHVVKNYSERAGGGFVGGAQIDLPLSTVTARDHHALATSTLIALRNHDAGRELDRPLGTIAAQANHHAEVRALLVKYYGNERDGEDVQLSLDTITAKGRFGLVVVDGAVVVDVNGSRYCIADVGFRMLTPRELARAQGFPDSYVLDRDAEGRKVKLADQVRLVGNSVPPQMAAALIRANL